jgi:hypothetical protein
MHWFVGNVSKKVTGEEAGRKERRGEERRREEKTNHSGVYF